MPNVTMPDGTVVAMPDQIDPAMGARLRAFQTDQDNKAIVNKPTTFGSALMGEASAAGRAIPNLASGAVHGLDDLSQTLVGHGGEPGVLAPLANWLHIGPSNAERNLTGAIANITPQPVKDAGTAIAGADQALNTKLGQVSPTLQHGVQATGRVANDLMNMAPAAGPLMRLGSAAGDALGSMTADTGPAAAPSAVEQAGFVKPTDQPVARFLAGDSGQTAQNLHNQQLHQTLGRGAANIPPGTPLNPESFEPARAEPNSVYASAAASAPTGPLSPTARAMINGVNAPNIIDGSPDAANNIASLKAQFTDPNAQFSGQDIVSNISQQRADGFQRLGSEDPSARALGRAQVQISNALEQHLADVLPADAPVSAADLVKARQALAMNHTVESITKPGGLIDPQALARIHADNPNLLTGNLRTMAQAATDNPEVNTLPTKGNLYEPPGVGKDLSSFKLVDPVRSATQMFFGSLGRRMLTGDTGAAVAKAQQAFPGTLGEDLAPTPKPSGPQPPPGMTASPPTAPAPAPAGPPGQIPLYDLLSHGVGEGGPQGLSLAPDVPKPEAGPTLGPQDRAAGFDTGGMELEHPAVTQSKALEETNHAVMTGAPNPNGDLGSVMSQGVPEGIAQRAQPPHQPGLGDMFSGNQGEGFSQMPSAMPPAKHFGGVLYRGAQGDPDALNEIGGRFLTEHVVPEEGGTAASDYGSNLKAYPVQSTKMLDAGTPQQAIKTFNLPNHASVVDIGKAARDAGYDLVKFNVDGKNEYLHFPGPEHNGP